MQNRRAFLQQTSAAITALGLPGIHALSADSQKEPRYKKAVKIGMVKIKGTLLDKFNLLKALGFNGVELSSPNAFTTKEVLEARDKSGLEIHGVVNSVHWRQPLSHPDKNVRANCVESLKTSLQDAKDYGATSVLLVPAVVNKEVSYDEAYKRSQEGIRQVLPLAEKLNIHILLENVWNNFLLSPLETARYVDELKSDKIGVYFDVGNVIRYGWPEHWIRILGKRIHKLDIKEYSRKKAEAEGVRKGFRVKLLEGDCDWSAVMKALRDIKYSGWGTAEIPGGGRERLEEIAQRMDRIFNL